MKRLTRVEERNYLEQALENGKYLDRGSSRAVFSLGNGQVIKVAIDNGGQFQNHTEIELFREYGNDYLAEIYFYGRYIVVAEEVDVYDYDELCEDFYYIKNRQEEDYEEEIVCDGEITIDGITESVLGTGDDVVDFLESVLGFTADNGQLGLRKETGRFVAYDYGFMTEYYEISISKTLGKIFNQVCGYSEHTFLKYVIDRII